MADQGSMKMKRVVLVLLALVATGLCITLLLGAGDTNKTPAGQQQGTPPAGPPASGDTTTPTSGDTTTTTPPPTADTGATTGGATGTTGTGDATGGDPAAPAIAQDAVKPSLLQSVPVKMAIAALFVAIVCVAAYVAFTLYQDSAAEQQRLLEEAEAKAAEEAQRQNEAIIAAQKAEAQAAENFKAAYGSLVFVVAGFVFCMGILGIIASYGVNGTTIATKLPFSWFAGNASKWIKYGAPIAATLLSAAVMLVSAYFLPAMAPFGFAGGLAAFLILVIFRHHDLIEAMTDNVNLRKYVPWVLVAISSLLYIVPVGLTLLSAFLPDLSWIMPSRIPFFG